MSIIKIRTKTEPTGLLLRIMIEHPMETGRRLDDVTGRTAPEHFIKYLTVSSKGKVVMEGQLSTAISKNPYLTFKLRDGQPGDLLEVSFKDNHGHTETAVYEIPGPNRPSEPAATR